ncbi:unnamed protein product [Polarella glacialis]|uniref:Uncharacterized protein n=1 Tax=Polarella glacialis TaxID=89957 RepID=A0A813JZQ4_POLGL|nr:unnamed protein product [Polarella glacialis]
MSLQISSVRSDIYLYKAASQKHALWASSSRGLDVIRAFYEGVKHRFQVKDKQVEQLLSDSTEAALAESLLDMKRQKCSRALVLKQNLEVMLHFHRQRWKQRSNNNNSRNPSAAGVAAPPTSEEPFCYCCRGHHEARLQAEPSRPSKLPEFFCCDGPHSVTEPVPVSRACRGKAMARVALRLYIPHDKRSSRITPLGLLVRALGLPVGVRDRIGHSAKDGESHGGQDSLGFGTGGARGNQDHPCVRLFGVDFSKTAQVTELQDRLKNGSLTVYSDSLQELAIAVSSLRKLCLEYRADPVCLALRLVQPAACDADLFKGRSIGYATTGVPCAYMYFSDWSELMHWMNKLNLALLPERWWKMPEVCGKDDVSNLDLQTCRSRIQATKGHINTLRQTLPGWVIGSLVSGSFDEDLLDRRLPRRAERATWQAAERVDELLSGFANMGLCPGLLQHVMDNAKRNPQDFNQRLPFVAHAVAQHCPELLSACGAFVRQMEMDCIAEAEDEEEADKVEASSSVQEESGGQQTEEDAPRSPEEAPGDFVPGQRVSLQGLMQKAAQNGRSGTLKSWDAERGRWVVEVGHDLLAVRHSTIQTCSRTGNAVDHHWTHWRQAIWFVWSAYEQLNAAESAARSYHRCQTLAAMS